MEVFDCGEGFDAAIGTSDEDRGEVFVDVALENRRRSFDLKACLDAGETAEPDRVEVAGAKAGDGRVVFGCLLYTSDAADE